MNTKKVFRFYHLGGEDFIIEGSKHRSDIFKNDFFFFLREITLEPSGLQLRNTNSREASWKRLTVSVCSSHRLGAEQQDHLGTY